jgi:hypothetical protein
VGEGYKNIRCKDISVSHKCLLKGEDFNDKVNSTAYSVDSKSASFLSHPMSL